MPLTEQRRGQFVARICCSGEVSGWLEKSGMMRNLYRQLFRAEDQETK